MASTGTTTTAPTHGNLIGGVWQVPQGAELIANHNPADTRQILSYTPATSAEETARAIEVAHAAFPAWRNTPAPTRGKILLKAAILMEQRKEELARALTLEEGKAYAESLVEMDRAINLTYFFAAEGTRLNGEAIPSALPNVMGYTERMPLGVVGVITPWNFPVAIPAWKIAPALIAGNTVVIKPSPLTPDTMKLIAEIYEEAGLPPGVLNVVFGDRPVGETLSTHPLIKAVTFTGSTPVGKAVYRQAATIGARCLVEMGGKNPQVILADADLELAAKLTVAGAFGSTGQRCTATSRVIVERSVADRFLARMIELTKAIKVGNGADPTVTMGPLVDENRKREVLRFIEIGKNEGSTLALGGNALEDGDHAHGHFIEPTIFTNVTRESTLFQEEVFGPVLSMTIVDTYEEALAAANDSKFGLSASIFTKDLHKAHHFVRHCESGMAHVNGPTIFSEVHLPFGGVKDSGQGGREMGKAALEFFTDWKAVYFENLM
ncbi:MAG: aldehyde dehydrogenase family protein [Candidatus Sericytochromatia bacterium]|nr:aldehyde dehydrogenase family protein [Candidatus Sericytochromatia bacterium]